MQPAELHAYILKRLGNSASVEELVYELCQKTGMPWYDARRLVEEIAGGHEQGIIRRQTPLMLLISAPIFALGAWQALSSFLSLRDLVLRFQSLPPADPLTQIGLIAFLLSSGPYTLVGLGIGLAMMTGSSFGLTRYFSAWLYR